MKKSLLLAAVTLSSLAALTACNHTKVARVDPDEVIDLSGRWNDSDSQKISAEMIDELAGHPWVQQHISQYGKKPVVIVGPVKNQSSEHILTETITKDLERALVNNGRVNVVASTDERGALRDELVQQQTWSSAETQKRLAAETGADYMLIGSIKSIIDQSGKKSVIFYKVNLELVQLETGIKAWIGDGEIKKFIKKHQLGL